MSAGEKRFKPEISPAASESGECGILNERVLLVIFEAVKWDIHALCSAAAVNRKLRAVAKRLLWRELCLYRAPRMASSLSDGGHSSRLGGGWQALAKLMFYCCGGASTRHFPLGRHSPGHFVKATRFSKTSGRSFLSKKCRGDLLFVSDPCEHAAAEREDDLGVYRGVFQGFMKSRTRASLITRAVRLEERVRCPFCGARAWSMTSARLVPKSAARRLGSRDGGLEYFVCVNGHLHGTCWLVPLSSDEEDGDDVDGDEDLDESDGGDGDGESGDVDYKHPTATNGSLSAPMSPTRDEIVRNEAAGH